MFARLQHHVMRFPEQRVVGTQAVRARRYLRRERLMVPQDGDLVTIDR